MEPSRATRIRRRAWVAAAIGLFAWGCLSPTLPLPPPSEPEVTPIGQDRYLLTGEVPAPGFVSALNLRTDELAGQATRDGHYSFAVNARQDDTLRLFYTDDNEISDPLIFRIEQLLPPGSAPDGGSADGAP